MFTIDGVLYRQINIFYRESYDMLCSSGLYDSLVQDGLIVPFEEVPVSYVQTSQAYRVIKPCRVPFIAYPYEWCFSQLKDAALATLAIQKRALEYGMSLKDSSAYNIQFIAGKPVLIDSLSFEPYAEGKPWVAYKQYCQHFLAPLALMSCTDIRLSHLLKTYIDGIPLDLASRLLPNRTRFSLGLMTHIHLHAKTQAAYADKTLKSGQSARKMSHIGLLGILDSLEASTRKLSWSPAGTEWADYYEMTNYTDTAFEQKRTLVDDFLSRANPSVVWDMGANTGEFSRAASSRGIRTVSFDIDPAAVEKNYLTVKKHEETCILPLILDLTNPSPSIGWAHRERMSLAERAEGDTVMALALIHHLAISNNVPLEHCAAFFAELCTQLIIEFVPKSDSQVQKLLSTREDIFSNYTHDGFEEAFSRFFTVVRKEPVLQSDRTLYLMKRK
ncbi:SAM-dependent methyltransferase [bacterium]|nr:SAM-dependent methyltransferase [bacterium]